MKRLKPILLGLKLIFAVVAFNLAVVYPLAAQEAPARQQGIFLITGIFDCCKEEGFCKINGCFFTHDCNVDGDCGPA